VTSRPLETGATAVEYALMAALIALVIVTAVTVLGTTVSGIFENAASLV
jgi:pilus assembly protein Flp/PilA